MTEAELIKKIEPEEEQAIVEEIVNEWNSILSNMQNTTIQLCLKIQEVLKDQPDKTIKGILYRVKEHPKIKKFVSIDRIWQGMRLVNNRPDLIEYIKKTDEEKEELDFKTKPYLKKDGEVFWEFYFELEKAPLNNLQRRMLEVEGKEDLWSFRDLRTKIRETKDDIDSPSGTSIENKRIKAHLLKRAYAMIRGLNVEQLEALIEVVDQIKGGDQQCQEKTSEDQEKGVQDQANEKVVDKEETAKGGLKI